MDAIKKYLPLFKSPAVILGIVGLGFFLLFVFIFGAVLVVPAEPVEDAPAAVMVITFGPTSTPYVSTPTPSRIPSPTSDIRPSPLPGTIGVGSYVQIFGTEGTGLNIRQEPGLSAEIKFVALDSEVFEVRDGPVEADGFVWWLLVTPFDESRIGWAAANYLSIVPEP